MDYNYEGLKMELDETSYEWGTCYEIEIETVSCGILLESQPACMLGKFIFAQLPGKCDLCPSCKCDPCASCRHT